MAGVSGGCACGALRYGMASAPVAQFQCQCRDCQKLGSSGHSSWLVFREDATQVVSGMASRWSSRSEGGIEKSHGFCPVCGSPVFLTFPASPGSIGVTASSLDDPSAFAPGFVKWGSSAQGWDRLDPALTVFAKMPPER